MKLRHFAAAVAVLATFAMTAAPASAASGVVVFTGNAQTTSPSGGTWAPVSPACGGVPCPNLVNWSFSSEAGAGVHGTAPVVIGPGSISGAGSFEGWCGHSIGGGLVNTLGEVDGITWVSAGGTLVLTGSGAHAAIVATVQARPIVGNCVTEPASQFLIAGAAVAV